jgi:hypothetical protein
MGPIVLALYELAYSNPLFYQLLFLPVTKEESPQRDEALRIQTIQELFIFCSYVLSMNGPKDSKSLQFNKLILLTLLCLVENDKINQLLHHTTGLYSVKLFTKSKVCVLHLSLSFSLTTEGIFHRKDHQVAQERRFPSSWILPFTS